jgi:hypothetical protein
MSYYIASNDNRLYAAVESDYGTAATVTEANRIPAIVLKVRQNLQTPHRIDKTGGRTFPGFPSGFRRRTSFELTTLMVGSSGAGAEPRNGPLFQAALGGTPRFFSGGTVQSAPNESQIVFVSPHNLVVNQSIVFSGELRFVASAPDSQTVLLNAPFTQLPGTGASIDPTVTYLPGTQLPSLTVFDYWDPIDSVHRLVTGGGVDRMYLRVNGDLHQFSFSGFASDVVDNASFVAGQAGLSSFPAEPPISGYNYSPVPGNLGQAWFGATAKQFFSVLDAELLLDNALDMRTREFGSIAPLGIVPGMRTVTASFRLYANTKTETRDLYAASRQRSPIGMMLQLGQQSGNLCGVCLKSIVPEIPEFEDDDQRLQWRFRNCRAQGGANDELVVAFG